MARITIAELEKAPLETIFEIVAEVRQSERTQTKDKKKDYFLLTLADSTAEIKASYWDVGKPTVVGETYIFTEAKRRQWNNQIFFNVGKPALATSLSDPQKSQDKPAVGAYTLDELAEILITCLKRFPIPDFGHEPGISLFIQACRSGIRLKTKKREGEDLPF